MIHYEQERFGANYYLEYAEHSNFSFPAHFHRALELIYMIEGEMDILYDTTSITLTPNQVALFLPNTIHGYQNKYHSRFISLVFSPDWVLPFIDEIGTQKAINPQFIFKEPFLKESILQLSNHLTEPLRVQAILLLISQNFLEQVALTSASTLSNELVHNIITYMNTHFMQDISLTSLAEAMGYSSSYLSRFISQNMHMTFNHYLTQLRLSSATYLLTHTNEKMVTIAMQSGFSSIRTFNGTFKKWYNMSPLAYKKSLSNLKKND